MTVLMHRYIESRPPVAFFNSSRGVRNFRGGGFNPPTPPVKYSPANSERCADTIGTSGGSTVGPGKVGGTGSPNRA